MLIFVLYPPLTVLALVVRLSKTVWERKQHYSCSYKAYVVSSITGLHIEISETESVILQAHHLWQAKSVERDKKKILRVGRAIALAFVSLQCIGTLARTASRLGGDITPWLWYSRFFATDFECFWLSVGMIPVLLMSWTAWYINVSWIKEDQVLPAPRPQPDPGVPTIDRASAVFYKAVTRITLMVFVLLLLILPVGEMW